MKNFNKILKYEFLNIIRNRWIFVYFALLFVLTLVLLLAGASPQKAILSISHVIVVLIPLVSLLFSTVYAYYNEQFTETLLTQPLSRPSVFWARHIAIGLGLGLPAALGISLPFFIRGTFELGLLLNALLGLYLTLVFVILGLAISTRVKDRMRGVGLAIGAWFFLAVVYDGLVLVLLLLLREYPLDWVSGALGVLNPIGLVRVVLLVFHDGALLLGYTGTGVRQLLTSYSGMVVGFMVGALWLTLPIHLSRLAFSKKDF
jgi:Cu-processing system permease protein